jgi:CBS domain-containing protein
MANVFIQPSLRKAAEQVAAKQSVRVTTRTFLAWFEAQRRGYWIVRDIRRQLEHLKLETAPDFESNYIDSFLELRPIEGKKSKATSTIEKTEAIIADQRPGPSWIAKDPTYAISKLAPANRSVEAVTPSSTLAEIVTILLSRDFSQLPVMTSERDVRGIVTWQSIGSRIALSVEATTAQALMEPHHEIRSHSSIFDAIPIVVKYQYVLIRGNDQKISGIVTASDLSEQFQILSEPFLLLGEIENLLRGMIAERFTNSDLENVRDPDDADREIKSPADLTFGEYVRLLENPERWEKFGLSIDRIKFREGLEKVRAIRNDVMHFDPDGIAPEQLKSLRDFANFLNVIQNIAGRDSKDSLD